MTEQPSLSSFIPGRFGCVVKMTNRATHAWQWVTEDSTSPFVLELAPDGSATAWRGWRYQFYNDGPEVHTADRFREQQGYRGHYEQGEHGIEINLASDDSVCPPYYEYSYIQYPRAPRLQLICQLMGSQENARLPSPSLVCEWTQPEPRTGERDAYLIPGILAEPRMVLGSGRGFAIELTYHAVNPRDTPEVKIELMSTALEPGAWDK